MNAAWIDHANSLAAPVDSDPVGLDTEFIRRNTFRPQLALVQVAHAGRSWLIDPLAYDPGPDLRALVVGHRCVMHSAGEDLEALAPLLGDVPIELFDTQLAAAMCGMGAGLSYQHAVERLVEVAIPKGETRSDWLHRPLTPSQLEYAEQDVEYLATLYEKLSLDLDRRGRTAWHAEDCARLVQRARRERECPDPQPQRSFPAASDWAPEAQARLRRVLRWRDDTARALDRPRPWILDDAHALALSQQPPPTPQELFDRVRGQRALRGPQRTGLFELLRATATPGELSALAPIPPAPRGTVKHAADAMRVVVKETADRLELPAGLLFPRRMVEEFAVTRTWPDSAQGWRQSVLEAALSPLLPG